MFRSLMTTRRFAPLFWCQFFAAFNDNFLRNALAFLILFKLGRSEALVTLGSAVFIAPAFLFSGLAGELADRYDKAIIARRLKFAEIAVAAVAAAGFILQSIPVLFLALFAFGVMASLFTPVKYGLLPDQLRREELPSGNALIEAATFLAILFGTIVGGLAVARSGNPVTFVVLVMVFATVSWLASRQIPKTVGAAPNLTIDRNIVRSTFGLLKHVWRETKIWRGSLMIGWFWMVGAVVLSILPALVKDALGGSEEVVTVYLALFSIGIAIGSAIAAWLASGRIILLPTPVAGIAMGLFMLDVGLATLRAAPPAGGAALAQFFASGSGIHIALDFLGLAIAGGIFIVPAFAAVQAWSEATERARVIAAVNVLSAVMMVVGAVGVAGLQTAGVSPPALFMLIGFLSVAAGLVILHFLPTSPLRDFLSILFRAIYRVEVRGAENLKKAGPSRIIALNHVSFLDAALALSLLDDDRGLRRRPRHLGALVGEALRQDDARAPSRPGQPDGDPRADQRGQGRRHPDHLPGRAADRHRQPDEGL